MIQTKAPVYYIYSETHTVVQKEEEECRLLFLKEQQEQHPLIYWMTSRLDWTVPFVWTPCTEPTTNTHSNVNFVSADSTFA
jgi:hypothetical protein